LRAAATPREEKVLTRPVTRVGASVGRMPWMRWRRKYRVRRPKGKVSNRLDLFGAPPSVDRLSRSSNQEWRLAEHACRGLLPGTPIMSRTGHLNARGHTLRLRLTARSRRGHRRLKARMGWEMPWYTITDRFEVDLGVDRCTAQCIHPRRRAVFRPYFINGRETRRWEPRELPRYDGPR